MKFIDNLSVAELQQIIKSNGESNYRADQIVEWLFKRGVYSYDQMSNIPLPLRDKLSTRYPITPFKEVSRESSLDGTIKFLFELSDGERIESVLLKDGDRFTGCISSQVGCRMGCTFCATFMSIGFKRNLTPAEIFKQVQYLRNEADKLFNTRLSNLVFMGMGEPLDNIDSLLQALDIILNDNYLGFSHRKVTVSTSGYLKNIDRLYRMETPVNLAVSINSPRQAVRKDIMPISNKYPLEELVKKLKTLELDKRKRITLEYILIDGVNDSLEDAKLFVKLIKGIKAKVNLIIYNSSEFTDFKEPDPKVVEKFQNYLIANKVSAFIRKRLGKDISAACGQLSGATKLRETDSQEADQ